MKFHQKVTLVVARRVQALRTYQPKRWHWFIALVGVSTAVALAMLPQGADPDLPRPTPAASPPGPDGTPVTPPELPPTAPDTATAITDPANIDWIIHTVESGDTLSGIFAAHGIHPRETFEILALGSDIEPLRRLYPGEVLRLQLGAEGRLQRLHYDLEIGRGLEIRRNGGRLEAQILTPVIEHRPAWVSGSIDTSFYAAGQALGLPDRLILELATVFGWDIDFALDIRTGDRFSVVFEEKYVAGHRIGTGDILAAEFVNQGRNFRAIRFTDPQGRTDYYTPDGQSMRKAFLKTPVDFRRISSRFKKQRFHPLLGVSRPHTGVDYSAAPGTPVRATGDGRVIFLGVKGGYGKTVILQHGQKYTTLYAHLRGFARGLARNERVTQGQLIGYVGSTGMATGPHLHYEFRVNNVFRNPLTVRVPAADPLPAEFRADFDQHAEPLIGQLEVLGKLPVAMDGSRQ